MAQPNPNKARDVLVDLLTMDADRFAEAVAAWLGAERANRGLRAVEPATLRREGRSIARQLRKKLAAGDEPVLQSAHFSGSRASAMVRSAVRECAQRVGGVEVFRLLVSGALDDALCGIRLVRRKRDRAVA